MINKAKRFAEIAHGSQKRKHSNDLYFIHLERVANRVWKLNDYTDNMVAAAYLHDTIEDTNTTEEDLIRMFNLDIAFLVVELTNPSKYYPKLPRDKRKEIDRRWLANASDEAKTIKLVDRIDNLRELIYGPVDGEFLHLYTQESELLVSKIRDANEELAQELDTVIKDAYTIALLRCSDKLS